MEWMVIRRDPVNADQATIVAESVEAPDGEQAFLQVVATANAVAGQYVMLPLRVQLGENTPDVTAKEISLQFQITDLGTPPA